MLLTKGLIYIIFKEGWGLVVGSCTLLVFQVSPLHTCMQVHMVTPTFQRALHCLRAQTLWRREGTSDQLPDQLMPWIDTSYLQKPWESISVHCDHQSGILSSTNTSGLEQLYVKSKGNIHTCLGRYEETTQLYHMLLLSKQEEFEQGRKVLSSPTQLCRLFFLLLWWNNWQRCICLVHCAKVQSTTDRKSLL